jgi:maltooligosyltrehalose trehalohydrolase
MRGERPGEHLSVQQLKLAAFENHALPPDPRAEETFVSAKLDQEQRRRGDHRTIFDFYRELTRLRKECTPLARLSREGMQVVACEEERVLVVNRSIGTIHLRCLFNYSDQIRVISPSLVDGRMIVLLDSTGNLPPGSGVTVYTTRPETFPTLPPYGVIVYRKE